MKKYYTLVFCVLQASFLLAQVSNQRPKLVVGIVVDQMRYDYLLRYYDKYGEDGFKKLMSQGFVCQNGHYNYVPTETGPGHASIYTGTTPAYHGIVGNGWHENGAGRYCAEDTSVSAVGGSSVGGNRSPKNMIVPTFGDMLKLSTNGQSRIFGVSLKDRGAILPAGHTANGAFWYDSPSGKFITSTYYMDKLPAWAQKFNDQKLAEKYLSQNWETLLPVKQYTESQADDNNYERVYPGKEQPTFPYDLKAVNKKYTSGQFKRPVYDLLTSTPFGNTLVNRFAQEMIKNENLGRQEATDVIAISFSSTDIIGHAFGPQSVEIQDTYLRLDKELASLLSLLDAQVGANNYVLFLSADHGAVFPPQYLKDNKLPGGFLKMKQHFNALNSYMNATYGQGEWLEETYDKGVYLNRKLIRDKKLNLKEVQDFVAEFMRTRQGVYNAYPAYLLQEQNYTHGLRHLVQNAYYPRRSADVVITHLSGWLSASWSRGGTSHGTGFNYDTHVPIVFYGWNIPKGKSTVRKVHITDIAATLSTLLNIQLPDGTTGQPIPEIFE